MMVFEGSVSDVTGISKAALTGNIHGMWHWRVGAICLGLCVCVITLGRASSGRPVQQEQQHHRPRLRELGIQIGRLAPGPWNAITDVAGVRVGHVTLIRGDSVRTGVTVILPHDRNPYRHRVPAAVYVANGFGKLVGYTQLRELGELETPIALTNTLSVWDVAIGLVQYVLSLPGNERVRSVNPVVGETNDGYLNDIRGRHVRPEHVLDAIRNARPGPVAEGAVGAGTGTVCFGFKGGIGTSSRQLAPDSGGWTVGVLVQTNFGGKLTVAGRPVWRSLRPGTGQHDGSCMIVIATDAPLNARQLGRLARRAIAGMVRTGASMSHGSGDYSIAFSTAGRPSSSGSVGSIQPVPDRMLDPLFEAVADATEEAILNSLLQATDMTGYQGHTVRAVPLELFRAK